jgi:undecaprenyl-diphosphatase
LAEWVGKRKRDMEQLRVTDALIVGGSQVLALIPGASRSGTTIMGGLFAGLNRETAARFSFLLSIPAIAASGMLELVKAVKELPPGSFGPLAIGTLVSGIVGYLSIWFLIRYLRKNSTGIFISYRLVVGAAILVLLSLGMVDPNLTPSEKAPEQPTIESAPLRRR